MMDIHLLRPWWLLATLPLLVIVWRMIRQHASQSAWQKVCDKSLLPYIVSDESMASRRITRPLTILIAGLIAIIALSGPAVRQQTNELFKDRSALVILLDLSRSMYSTDIKPDRISRARYKIEDLLKLRPDGETALIVYTDQPYMVTPLTDDTRTIDLLLPTLNPDMMPAQGSQPAAAVSMGIELMQQAGLTRGELLLVSDGIGDDSVNQITTPLDGTDFTLSVLAVGTDEAEPVPLKKGGYLKHDTGKLVLPELEREQLKQVASAGHGIYRELEAGSSDIRAFISRVDVRKSDSGEDDRDAIIWRDLGPWLMPILLLLLLPAFRQPALLGMALIMLLPMQPAYAGQWDDLWLTPDQQATSLLEQDQPGAAAEQFENRQWQAAAAYRDNDYATTVASLEGIETSDAWYNKGNAHAMAGDYQAAMEDYEKSLALNSDNDDARYNLEQVRKALEQQQQEQQDQQNQSQDDEQNESQNSQNDQSQDGQEDSQQQDQSRDDQQEQGDQQNDAQDQQQSASQDGQQDQQDDSSTDTANTSQSGQSQTGEQGKDERNENPDSQNAAAESMPDNNMQTGADNESAAEDDSAGTADMAEILKQHETHDDTRVSGEDEEQPIPEIQAQGGSPLNLTDEEGEEDHSNVAIASNIDALPDNPEAERWLREIPDSPGSLLEQKFRNQYRRNRPAQGTSSYQPW